MAHLILRDPEIDDLLHGPNGPVFRLTKAFAEAIVEDVKLNGPLGFGQGGRRHTGGLRAAMKIESEFVDPTGVHFIVGTNPVNPEDGYHYAERVHRGHDGFESTQGEMKFQTKDGAWHHRFAVGPADAVPFLYDSVVKINNTIAFDQKFELRKT